MKFFSIYTSIPFNLFYGHKTSRPIEKKIFFIDLNIAHLLIFENVQQNYRQTKNIIIICSQKTTISIKRLVKTNKIFLFISLISMG